MKHKRDDTSAVVIPFTDFSFAFNVCSFSDRFLRVEIVDDEFEFGGDRGAENGKRRREVEADGCDATSILNTKNMRSTPRIKKVQINSAILASKSRFFLKLFSNGMKESSQRRVTVRIKPCEEDAFKDLLYFIYTNRLSSITERALVDVLMIADKFEVISCTKHCCQKLLSLEMSLESALLYLDLQSDGLKQDAIKPLVTAAKQFLTSRYNDITKSVGDVLGLPLAAFEVVVANDNLCVPSEDDVVDLVMKYICTHYPSTKERHTVLMTRLCHIIRFSYLSRRKLRNVLKHPCFNEASTSNSMLNALLTKASRQRSYSLAPVKVVKFKSSEPQYDVYMDLKRDECIDLFPNGMYSSQSFRLKGLNFRLAVVCDSASYGGGHHFCIHLMMDEHRTKKCTANFKFYIRTNDAEDFEQVFSKTDTYTGAGSICFGDLLKLDWSEFIAADSKYFDNDVLHLKAVFKVF